MKFLCCCETQLEYPVDKLVFGAGLNVTLALVKATLDEGCSLEHKARKKRAKMSLGPPQRKRAPLGVLPMALALVVAAFMGAAVGLVWQDDGLGDAEEAEEEVLTKRAPPG